METSQARKDAIFRKKLVDTFCNYGIYIIFLIMIIYFSVQSTGFLSLSNAITVLQLSSTLGISVVGMFFVLITGGIDISVASNMYFSAVVGTTLLNNLGCPLILCFVGSCLSGPYHLSLHLQPTVLRRDLDLCLPTSRCFSWMQR